MTRPLRPLSVAELVDAVRGAARVRPVGNRTKPALARASEEAALLDVSGLRGILEYDPAEYTITALAGTPVSEVASRLAEHGQALPFDPPFRDAGATLGGTLAAGLSGSGLWRHGGLRDFVLGVRFVDGTGRLIRGGAKVVKNAAGFDFPKLLVGSLGRLGVVAEITFKVFPAAGPAATVRARLRSMADAFAIVPRIAGLPVVFDCLDLEPPADVVLRVSGEPAARAASVARLRTALAGAATAVDVVTGAEEERLWADVRELSWATARTLVKVPTTWATARALEPILAAANAARRYAAAGNTTWIAWPDDGAIGGLNRSLAALGLTGLVLRGSVASAWLGANLDNTFYARVRRAIDPVGRFDI